MRLVLDSNVTPSLCISIHLTSMSIHSKYKEECLRFSMIYGLNNPDSRFLCRFPEVKGFKSPKKLYKFTYPFCHLVLYFNLRVMKDVLNHYGNSKDNSICPLEIGFSR